MKLYIPADYRPTLASEDMEEAIKMLKRVFQEELAATLKLRRVTAPLFVFSGTGMNDDLNGVERAVSFPIKDMNDRRAEVVHSLAKWKRMKLGFYNIPPGEGLYTDMNAIRADEELDNIHSIYVDQWDWERTIRAEDRHLDFLRMIVDQIYGVLKTVEEKTYRSFPHITPFLPEKITYLHAEELLAACPDMSPKDREYEAAKKYGAIFIIGIGATLSNGEKHDGRAPDYDDWSTPTVDGHRGLNGDIILWNPVLDAPLEISSMGIRVDREAMLRQLKLENCMERRSLAFHRALLNGEIPLSIGGGIGQSRLCMYFLRCAHIGEVQASLWSDEMIEQCRANHIILK
ncbi:aspartate--ammonia ligase [Tannerella forsythia]|uniref:Aspartate--ammonia ligase n=1 Tax=Tannerella forsythia (strain ATCC 43037 / JCM 10827 / CCUG 21028 A / KCTC 5666 / FDC 338) TaxID=203275 RepID=G8UJZ4_TANFA|nr:aspartate--ammonia ligase [Tannerella forsythia]AEW20942.1 aspartate--ammonia ligase [Tannerella forsythia 92A2]